MNTDRSYDQQQINTLNGGDLIDFRERFGRFNHDEDHRCFVESIDGFGCGDYTIPRYDQLAESFLGIRYWIRICWAAYLQ